MRGCSGGHVWLLPGEGGVCVWLLSGGVCVVFLGACMVFLGGGACVFFSRGCVHRI